MERKGVGYNDKKKKWHCPDPAHADNDPSSTLYDEERLHCQTCGGTWDIFEVAGLLDGLTEFPDKLKAVQETLGMSDVKPAGAKKKAPPKSRPKPPPLVALTKARAQDVFNPVPLVDSVKKFKWLDGDVRFVKVWAYYNADGLIELFDVRFENEHGKKAVITFYWDGKVMRSSGAPVLLFNRDKISADPDSPILIVEGAKTAEAAADIPGFIPVTWNGGGKKCKQADWTPLKDRIVYIYPDDDQKVYGENHAQAGEVLPPHEQPGMVTAMDIKKKLPQAKIVQPIESARKIKADGADIVEVMQVPNMTPETVADYILNGPEFQVPAPPSSPIDTAREIPEPDVFPFRILGVADDGKAYFLDRHERMASAALKSLTQNMLLTLAPLTFWQGEFATGKGGIMGKDDWTAANDAIIQIAGSIDFDPDRIRGRGAWRERDGRICYHDGVNTIGEPSQNRLYLRMTLKDIGIDSPPPDKEALKTILGLMGEMSFETRADMIRCLAWSTLAPFAGALPWRSAGLLTGRSGVGKSEIVNLIIKPLSLPHVFSGGESTEAGVRQDIGIDAAAIVIDEADTDTQKKKQRRDDVLSLMRQSTSDEAPKVAKGTIDGKGMRFTLRSMFMFAAISPEVESIADDNRLFRINLEGQGHSPKEWYELKMKLSAAITTDLCNSVRALTWTRLKDIFVLADQMSPIIQKVAGKSSRFATSESLLFAAYQIIWKQSDLTENDIYAFFEQIYQWQPPEESRDETDELLDRLLDEIIQEGNKRYSIRQVLQWEISGIGDAETWQQMSGRYGLRITPDGDLAIAKGHHAIMRIIERSKGYQRIFWRHPLLKDKNKSHAIAGTVRSCVVISGDILKEQGKEPF